MPVQRFEIDATTVPFGPCEVYYGDPTTADGMEPLGLTEGDTVTAIRRKLNTLTFPEHTGAAPIKADAQVDGITATIPLLITDASMMAKLSPTGVLSLGEDNFQPVQVGTLLIISRSEVDETTGLSYNGTVWAPAAPKNALWIWKAVPAFDRLVWGWTDMGKRMVEVPFEAHYDTTKPSGQKLATVGNPVTQGVTGIEI